MEKNNDVIHEAVREHYGAFARQAALGTATEQAALDTAPARSSCCSTSTAEASCCSTSTDVESCGCSPKLYDDQLLADLPASVTNLSAGCGDPVTIASLKPGEAVLDLGSGGGIDCFMAWRQVGLSGRVIGVDMTPDMLDRANINKEKLGAANVEFRQGQIEALPVESNSIDVVMSNCVINLSPDKPAVFREAFRVLKPGGRVSISDIVTEGDFSPEQRAELNAWAGCITGAIDVDAYTGMMRDAGFVDVKVVDKVDGEDLLGAGEGMPRIYSGRITGRKPEQR